MALADKRSCPHSSTTLVQRVHPEFGWSACYQCNDCGNVTLQDVTADAIDEALSAPWVDEDSYMSRTTERLEGEAEWTALSFVDHAKKKLPRNGNRK